MRWGARTSPLFFAIAAAGCTALNSAYDDAQNETGTSHGATGPSDTQDPSSSTTNASLTSGKAESSPGTTTETTDVSGTTGMSETSTTGPTVEPGCFDEYEACDAFEPDTCVQGQCRPLRRGREPWRVSCAGRAAGQPVLALGDACAHPCPGEFGGDGCPPRSVCDPFSNTPTCVPMCDAGESAPTCVAGEVCVESEDDGDEFGLCRSGCDPVSQNCLVGQACVHTGTYTCVPAGETPEFGACEFVNACAPGLACVPGTSVGCGGAAACCTWFCTLGSDECNPPLECNPFADGYGVCTLPE